jgi:hypothetical protein
MFAWRRPEDEASNPIGDHRNVFGPFGRESAIRRSGGESAAFSRPSGDCD